MARGPAVVVSAMSRVTDGLLGVADSAGASHLAEALSRTQSIRERHIATARELVSGRALDPLVSQINAALDDLTDVIKALAVLREVSPRTLDVVAAVGELLSSRIIAAALTSAGVDAEWVDARQVIVTNNEHTRATPLGKETNARLRSIVGPILDSGRVAVLGGFVGATLAGHTTTLGRGGSDYSGALVGAGVGRRRFRSGPTSMACSAPTRVSSRRKAGRHLSFAEAAELAYFGAKVLHPSTILPAVDRNIPVRILNSWKPAVAGTLITGAGSSTRKGLTGLASKRDVTVIDITSTRMLAAYGFLRQVFEVFERFTTAVDMVTTSEVSVSVTVDDIRHLEEIEEALSEFASVSVERNMSLLCAVGDVLQHEPEMAARVVGVFEEVPLRMISQAASRRNITVVLRQGDLPHAMERLHEEFFS